MPYLSANGVRLYFTDEGAGQPLVFIHGWTCDSTDWTWMHRHLEGRFRLVAYDRRGHGRSSEAAEYSMVRQLEDLDVLVEALGLDAPILVGHSAGGVIASALAIERPGLARAIFVLDPPYAADEAGQAGADGLAPQLTSEDGREVVMGFFELMFAAGTPSWLPTLVRRRVAALAPEVIHGDFQAVWSHPGHIARRPRADAYLRRRSCPVLAIHAMREMAGYERSVFADDRSRAIDWPGSGHWINVERAAECAALLEEWAAAF